MNKQNQKVKYVLEAVSERIRYFRRQKRLSMGALAEKAGFTKSYISQIENRKRKPTIGTLVSIAHALGVDIFSILNGDRPRDEKQAFVIVKSQNRREVKNPDMPSETRYESINYLKKDRLIDAYILTSGFEFSEKPRSHEGQELLFVLQGRMELIYDGKKYLLDKGDACCFDSNIPHYGRSLGKKESKALVVFSMPPKG